MIVLLNLSAGIVLFSSFAKSWKRVPQANKLFAMMLFLVSRAKSEGASLGPSGPTVILGEEDPHKGVSAEPVVQHSHCIGVPDVNILATAIEIVVGNYGALRALR